MCEHVRVFVLSMHILCVCIDIYYIFMQRQYTINTRGEQEFLAYEMSLLCFQLDHPRIINACVFHALLSLDHKLCSIIPIVYEREQCFNWFVARFATGFPVDRGGKNENRPF